MDTSWQVVTFDKSHKMEPDVTAGLLVDRVEIRDVTPQEMNDAIDDPFVTLRTVCLQPFRRNNLDDKHCYVRSGWIKRPSDLCFAPFAGRGEISTTCRLVLDNTSYHKWFEFPSTVTIFQTQNDRGPERYIDGRHYYFSFFCSVPMKVAIRETVEVDPQWASEKRRNLICMSAPDALEPSDEPFLSDIPFAPHRTKLLSKVILGYLDDAGVLTHGKVLQEIYKSA